jgi:serine/threonine-protein kinase
VANILVVDDEPGIREFLVETLATDGHHLAQASSGDAAVKRLSEEPFDLLITDLRMPGKLDGMDVVREARRTHPETRVIVLTAHGSVATAVDAMKIGAVDFLEKPMSGPTELRILVSRALADSENQQDEGVSDTTEYIAKQLSRALGGDYRVDDLIGKGGYAAVFAVQDLRLDRPLAAKALLPEFAASEDIAARFRREARTMAKLSHPNIMPVFFVGREREVPFFVMPRIVGASIGEMVRRQGHLELSQVVRIASDIASALDYAHAAGVIHRDVKPENILVDEASGRAVLTDFGISKAVVPEAAATATVQGVFLGTPQYSAPEQIAGEGKVDARADIYSFAVVIYEMISGRVPFDGPNASRVAAQHLFSPVPPLSRSAPHVSRKVDDVIARAMAKSPGDRFPSAGAFVGALEAALPRTRA